MPQANLSKREQGLRVTKAESKRVSEWRRKLEVELVGDGYKQNKAIRGL